MKLTYVVCIPFFVGVIYERFEVRNYLHTNGIHRILCLLFYRELFSFEITLFVMNSNITSDYHVTLPRVNTRHVYMNE